MCKIHLIMPMAGGGTRFLKEGFSSPKPLIMLQGKPFFFWAVRSVTKYVDVQDITFVVLKKHVDEYSIDSHIRKFFPNAFIKVIPKVLNGAVLSCLEGLKNIDDDMPILFNDCDHAFICQKFYDFCNTANFKSVDGGLLTFTSQSPNFSYVKFDNQGKVIGTIEKQVVSNEAICGAYYFRNKDIFQMNADTYMKHCNYKEFFVSGIYNEMASHGNQIITFPLEEHITFGTPKEYQKALDDNSV